MTSRTFGGRKKYNKRCTEMLVGCPLSSNLSIFSSRKDPITHWLHDDGTIFMQTYVQQVIKQLSDYKFKTLNSITKWQQYHFITRVIILLTCVYWLLYIYVCHQKNKSNTDYSWDEQEWRGLGRIKSSISLWWNYSTPILLNPGGFRNNRTSPKGTLWKIAMVSPLT
jgi:hypothetical protein